MIRRFKKEIDGAIYQGTTLPARKGISVGARLVKMLAPAAGGLKSAADLDGNSSGHLGAAIAALVERIEDDKVLRLILDMLEGMVRIGVVEEDGERVQLSPSDPLEFDVIYNSNYEELVKVLGYVVEVNLPGFFGKSNIGKVWERVRSQIDSQISGSESQPQPTQT